MELVAERIADRQAVEMLVDGRQDTDGRNC